MLRFLGSSHTFCDGVSRRNFLQIGAFGAGLTLADMLRLQTAQRREQQQEATAAVEQGRDHDLPARRAVAHGHVRPQAGRARRSSAASSTRSRPTCPACRSASTSRCRRRCGTSSRASARIVSVDEHSDTLVMTGYPDRVNRTAEHPSFGSVVSKLRAESNGAVPPFVSLRGMSRGTEPGYLGIAHRPFTPGGQGNANLRSPTASPLDRLDDRKDAARGLRRHAPRHRRQRHDERNGRLHREGHRDGHGRRGSHGARHQEGRRRRRSERYKGVEQFLTARRLVEAGVGCVTLSIGGWDTHGQNFQTLKRQLPQVDQGIANLISDLHDRGMADDVVTVMWGEFGRTPKINGNAGRDHWSPVMSAP